MVLKVSLTVPSTQKEDLFSKLVGEFGLWQLIIFSSVFLVKLSSSWVQMAILFLTPKLTFWCAEFGNSTQVAQNSTCYSACERYEYDPSPFESSIVSEWDLVCDRAWLASFNQMMLQFGILVGSIIFGFLSDRYGRHGTFLGAVTLLVALGFAQPFARSYELFTALRVLLGMATAGTMVVSFVIIMEAVGPSYREVIGCLYQIPFIVGHMTVPLFAYYFRAWRSYLLALAVPQLMYLGYFFVLSESPRWLLSVGRLDDAKAIVFKAARMNKLPTANIEQSLSALSAELQARREQPKPNYLVLLKPTLRLKASITCVIWFALGVTFYGVNQYISQTSQNPFVSVAAAGAIQIPANLISIWLIKRLGRRLTTSVFYCLCGACNIALIVAPASFWLSLTLGTLGVSFAAVVAATIYIYTSEMFPTVVRNMALGAASTSTRAGSMLAPFVANASAAWLSTAVFGGVPVAAGLLVLLLPETRGQALPDSIDQMDNPRKPGSNITR